MNRLVTILLALAIVSPPARAGALAVVSTEWGFGGKVVPGRIAILSVELANPSPAPFEGALTLYKGTGLGAHVDAPLVEPCFLSPGASRWVQFYPYVRREDEQWWLEWGPGPKDRSRLPGPKLGPPARVVLYDADDPLGRSAKARYPLFPENLFPPTVAATDGLHSVLLDHAPRWEPVRREAFLDWLRRGGEVHVVQDRAGRHPVFPGELGVLNAPSPQPSPRGRGGEAPSPQPSPQGRGGEAPSPQPSPQGRGGRHHVGGGLVVRHGMPCRDVTDDTFRVNRCPAPKMSEEYTGYRLHDLEEPLFQALRNVTRPRHAWGLIYLTVIAYIMVLGPANLVFSRKRRDYRLSLLFFFLSVAGAAGLLYFLGRRGHDETTAVHSLAFARQIGPDTYDVTQWVNAFVTSGATYDITHDAPHNLYSGCTDHERVPGYIANGKDGLFKVEIPLFSHRPFLHRAKLKGHHIKLSVVTWRGESQLDELVLAPEPGFPEQILEGWALYRDAWYALSLRDGQLHSMGHRADTESFFPESAFQFPAEQWPRRMRYGRYGEEEEDLPPERLFARFPRALIAREVGGTGRFYNDISRRPSERDHLQVFLFTRAPQGFEIKSRRLGRRLGFVLYRIDLFRPEVGDR
ncbi:MAG: hypothetical protein FJ291_02305 [Planctomycetes bacterium]|nr:hypothetical protein [Planctomycetota bacterium]